MKQDKKNLDIRDIMKKLTSEALTLASTLPEDRVGAKIADALMEHSLNAYKAHSRADGEPTAVGFTQQFRVALEELRALRRILQLLETMALPCDGEAVAKACEDVDMVVRIFFSSIRTLEAKA